MKRRILFGLLTVVLFFGLAEAALWLAGVPTLLAERDPFQGFSRSVRVFELDRERGLWHTPERARRHSFSYQQFAEPKAPGTFRFFTLGGSTALGFPWGPDVAFTARLGRALEASWPGVRVEAVNASAMSYGSHRLRILAAELLEHAPDALVLYMGHNEFVERRFYHDVLERPARLDELRRWLYRSRVATAFDRAWRWLSSRAESEAAPPRELPGMLGLDVERAYSTEVDDAERQEAVRVYEENLAAILGLAHAAGVPVVLCTVPSNLRDWRPNQSFFADPVASADREGVKNLLAAAREDLEQGQPAAALGALEQARSLAPGYAETWFLLGRAHEARESWAEAREAYRRARDLDGKPSRAIGAINEAIRRLARRDGVVLVDIEQSLDQAAPHAIPGFDLFEDYVHLKPATHKRVALELWRAFHEAGLARREMPAADERVFWQAVGPLEATEPVPLASLTEASTPQMLFNLAVVLENGGAIEEAIAKYESCLELDPRYYAAGYNLARLEARRGRHAQAIAAFERVLSVAPDYARAWIGLGESLERSGDLAGAERALGRATEVDPRSAHAWSSLGLALVARARRAEAADAFREAIALDPHQVANRVNLGLALLFERRLEEAEGVFREALELRPHESRARNGLAAVLAERGQLEEAARLFRESLAADPEDRSARDGLAAVERRRRATG